MFYDENAWQIKGECYLRRDELFQLSEDVGYDIFMPPKGKSIEAIKYSNLFCRDCPVKTECWTAGKDEHGTWGGDSYVKRRRLVRDQNTVLSKILERLGTQLPGATQSHSEDSEVDRAS